MLKKNVVTSVFVVRPWRRLTREENKRLAYKSVSFENPDDTLLDPSACEPFAQAQGYQPWIRPLRVVNAPSFNETLLMHTYTSDLSASLVVTAQISHVNTN